MVNLMNGGKEHTINVYQCPRESLKGILRVDPRGPLPFTGQDCSFYGEANMKRSNAKGGRWDQMEGTVILFVV